MTVRSVDPKFKIQQIAAKLNIPYRKVRPRVIVKEGNIISIDLRGGLSKKIHRKINDFQIPVSIFNGLDDLKILKLSNNDIWELPEGIFNELISLETLSLSHCSLQIIPHDIFKNLSELQKLDLFNNSLRYLPESIYDLKKLQSLNLSWTNLPDPLEIKFERDIAQVQNFLRTTQSEYYTKIIPKGDIYKGKRTIRDVHITTLIRQNAAWITYSRQPSRKVSKTYVSTRKKFQKCASCSQNVKLELKSCSHCNTDLPFCQICKSGYLPDAKLSECKDCGNIFHFEHLYAWVQSSGTCPLCKISFTLNEI